MIDDNAKNLINWYMQNVSSDVWTNKCRNWLASKDPNHSSNIQKTIINPIINPMINSRINSKDNKERNQTTKLHLKPSHVNNSNNAEPTYLADWVRIAEKSALSTSTLQELKAAVLDYKGCEIRKYTNQGVFGDGNTESKILVLGEAPGEEEDIQGKPFVGESGKLQTEILSSIGLERSKHYFISNVFYWRPPGNRQPTQNELFLCRPFVKRLISLFNPALILLLGKTATDSIFGAKFPITKIRGVWKNITTAENIVIPCLPCYHPAFLLRQPSRKAEVWQDMLSLQKAIKEKIGDKYFYV